MKTELKLARKNYSKSMERLQDSYYASNLECEPSILRDLKNAKSFIMAAENLLVELRKDNDE